MSDPVEEYFSVRDGEKTAAPGGLMSGAAKAFSPENIGRLGAEALLIGGGAAVLTGGVGKMYRAIMKKRHFGEMMDLNPDLAEHQREDPKRFNAHYSSLRSMNPQFAADPVIAGTYMRQMSLSPETAGKVVVESLGGVPQGGSMSVSVGGEKPPQLQYKF